MRVDVELLNRSIAASGKTKETVAKEIGIDYSTFSRKMNCEALAFSVGQMHKLVDILSLSDDQAAKIFLLNDSQNCKFNEDSCGRKRGEVKRRGGIRLVQVRADHQHRRI